jgi:hypothetical protein
MNISTILVIVAVILFAVAAFLPENSGRLVAAGLAFFAGSFVVGA